MTYVTGMYLVFLLGFFLSFFIQLHQLSVPLIVYLVKKSSQTLSFLFLDV